MSGLAETIPASGARFQEILDSFHEGEPDNGETLKVIYFHPADNPPQLGYEERTDRILTDFSNFLQAEITRHGFTNSGIPFERNEGGTLQIHLVTGSGNSTEYQYRSGQRVRMEAEKALGEEVDFSKDFVFILCGLCQKRGENDFLFHSPYYGDSGSNQIRGLCYAADCEVLDPNNLTREAAKISFRYEEHNGIYKKTLARFNSWYLGGIAHELGHGLSLPHNGELPETHNARGRALMGGGNHTYGEDRWGGGKGTFLEFANAIRLSAHPLFTKSDKGRFAPSKGGFDQVRFIADGQSLQIRGTVKTTPPPLAVIAYSDPPGRDGYNAITWVSRIEADGSFRVDIEQHPFSGLHDLDLYCVQVNGAVRKLDTQYRVSEQKKPDAETLNARFIALPAERAIIRQDNGSAEAYIANELEKPHSETTKKILSHLRTLMNPPEPISPITFEGNSLFLSDAIWEKAVVGWGKPMRNQYFHTPQSRRSILLELGGNLHPKGLYAHAPSHYSFSLDGKWKTFETVAGLQAGVGPMGRSKFIIMGDGKVLATSKVLQGAETETLRADLTDIQSLHLKVETTIEGNPQCWSIWAAPKITR